MSKEKNIKNKEKERYRYYPDFQKCMCKSNLSDKVETHRGDFVKIIADSEISCFYFKNWTVSFGF